MDVPTLRQQLSNLTSQTGVIKQADRFRNLLEQILTSDDILNLLKIFIEASKYKTFINCLMNVISNLFDTILK